jgi:hypothetical protein
MMASAMAQSLSWYGPLTSGLRREAKKAAALTFLVSVLGILWIRMAMKNGDTPAVANASNRALSVPDPVSRGGEATVAFKTWLNTPLASIKRNLFSVDLNHFPQENRSASQQANNGAGFWGELAKSVSARADVTKERQILLENLQQQASQLRLETTLMGAKPKAVVNGGFVGLGDVVASGTGEARTTFRVIKIEARRIIVEREGIKLEVPMKK